MKVTAQMLHAAISAQDNERHGAEQAYFGPDDCRNGDADFSRYIFDGRMNLHRVAEILSKTLEASTDKKARHRFRGGADARKERNKSMIKAWVLEVAGVICVAGAALQRLGFEPSMFSAPDVSIDAAVIAGSVFLGAAGIMRALK